MRFEELLRKDEVHAFSEFISVKLAKEQNLIPKDFAVHFKDDCECGSEMIITRSLSKVMCCDPRCWIKMYKSLAEVFDRFTCKNVGEGTCRNIVRYARKFMNRQSHLEVFIMDDKYLVPDVRGMAFVHFKEAVYKCRNRSMTFAEMVSRIAIPGFDSGTCSKVFYDVSSVRDMVAKMKEIGSVQGFLNLRGVEDPMKVFYLTEFLEDILFAEAKIFKPLRSTGKLHITVCITGNLSVSGYRVIKEEFVNLCNEIGILPNNIRLFEIEMNTAIASTKYVIADYASNTAKYKTAKAREEFEGRKIIYSAEEFIKLLKEVVECVTENKPLPEGIT